MRDVSVVIPTLNEELAIGETLDSIARVRGVADCGNADATAAIAESRGARGVRSERGRGVQMHAGAQASSGEVLWFLHADSRAPADAVDRIEEALRDPRVAGGNFAIVFDGDTRPARETPITS
jgi:glycosyltransferase involved in cell wall biosynthesis